MHTLYVLTCGRYPWRKCRRRSCWGCEWSSGLAGFVGPALHCFHRMPIVFGAGGKPQHAASGSGVTRVCTIPDLLEEVARLAEEAPPAFLLDGVAQPLVNRLLRTTGLVSLQHAWVQAMPPSVPAAADESLETYDLLGDDSAAYLREALLAPLKHIDNVSDGSARTNIWRADPSETSKHKARAKADLARASPQASSEGEEEQEDGDEDVAEHCSAAGERASTARLAHALIGVWHRSKARNALAARQQSRLMIAQRWPDRAHQMLHAIGLALSLSTAKKAFGAFAANHEPASSFWLPPSAGPAAAAEGAEAAVSVQPGAATHLKVLVDNINLGGFHSGHAAGAVPRAGETQRGTPLYRADEDTEAAASSPAGVGFAQASVDSTTATPDVTLAVGGLQALLNAFSSRGGTIEGMRAAHYAVGTGNVEMIRVAGEQHGCAAECNGLLPAHMLCLTPASQLAATVVAVVAAGEPGVLNQSTNTAGTPLFWACRRGAAEAARALLLPALGCKNVRGSGGKTPLHWAAAHDLGTVVELLVSVAHADVTVQDRYGATALHCAVAHKAWAGVRALLAAGADPSVPNGRGETALHLVAAVSGLAWVVTDSLRGCVRSPDARRGSDQCTALDLACHNEDETLVEALLAAGASPHRQSGQDDTHLLDRAADVADADGQMRHTARIAAMLTAAAALDTRCRHTGPCTGTCTCVKHSRQCTSYCWSKGAGNPMNAAASHASRRVAGENASTKGMYSTLDGTVTLHVEMEDTDVAAPPSRVRADPPTVRELMTHSEPEAAFAGEFLYDVHAQLLVDVCVAAGVREMNLDIDQQNQQDGAEQKEHCVVAPRAENRRGMEFMGRRTEVPTKLHKVGSCRVRDYQPNSIESIRHAVGDGLRDADSLQVAAAGAGSLMRTSALAASEDEDGLGGRWPPGLRQAPAAPTGAAAQPIDSESAEWSAASTVDDVARAAALAPQEEIIPGLPACDAFRHSTAAGMADRASHYLAGLQEVWPVGADQVPADECDAPYHLVLMQGHMQGGFKRSPTDKEMVRTIAGPRAVPRKHPMPAGQVVTAVQADGPIQNGLQKVVNGRRELSVVIVPEMEHCNWHCATAMGDRINALGLGKIFVRSKLLASMSSMLSCMSCLHSALCPVDF